MSTRKHRPAVTHDVNEQSAYELWCWGGPAKADEVVEFHRSRTPNPINPENIRKLCAAMIQGAFDDIRRYEVVRSYWFDISFDYRPDPVGARRWLASDRDAPLSFVWCCQVLKLSPSAIRRKVPPERTELTVGTRKDDAALRRAASVKRMARRRRARNATLAEYGIQ